MSWMDLFAAPSWHTLVAALLHTLWQAPAVAVLLAVALRFTPVQRAGRRYGLCLSALILVVLSTLATWAALNVEGRAPDKALVVDAARSVSVAAVSFSEPAFAAAPAPVVPKRAAAWPAVVAVLWLCGVLVMLARAMLLVSGVRRMRRQSRPLADPVLLKTVEAMQRAVGIRRGVKLLVVEGLHSPAAMGVIWPALAFPAAMLTGMPAEAWAAITAHELAHIRRFDYLINLAQLLIEAALFFNPAVWWISHQIRIEREACCDQWAARAVGQPLGYARNLTEFAAAVAGPSSLALAALTDGRRGTLSDRVRRLLVPGYQPAMRISWGRFAVAVLVGAALLAGLWRGTEASVVLAAKALSPQERVDRIQAAASQYAPFDDVDPDGRAERARLLGTVRTSDGRPLPAKLEVLTVSKSPRVNSFASQRIEGSTFKFTVSPGSVWIALDAEGYALALHGPIVALPGASVEGIDLLLEPGFNAALKITDPDGKPVPEAQVRLSQHLQNVGTAMRREYEVNDAGRAALEHVNGEVYAVEITAAGYEPADGQVTFKPGQEVAWKLIRARPATGQVVDEQGLPIEGARLRFCAEEGGTSHGETGPVLATTDDQGRYVLDSLKSSRSYLLIVESPDGARTLVEGVRAGQEGRRVQLRPLAVKGRVTGDLKLLHREKGRPVVTCGVSITTSPNTSHGLLPRTEPVELRDGAAWFEFNDLLPGTVTITAGPLQKQLELREPIDDLVLDINEKALPRKRMVHLVLKSEAGAPVPEGLMEVYSYPPEGGRWTLHEDLDITQGRAEVEANVGERLSYRLKRLAGYWFSETRVEVPPGAEPLRIEIPLVPAGAIVGRVLGPDGKPAAVGVSLEVIDRAPGASVHDQPPRADASPDGSYMLSPVLLGGRYIVVASLDKNLVFSDPIEVNAANPMPRVDLKLVQGRDAVVQVLDGDGQPLVGIPVQFSHDGPHGGTSYSPAPLTDAEGRVRFPRLNPDPRIKYSASVQPHRDWRVVPAAKLVPGSEPTVIRVQPGLVTTGRVVGAVDGKPLAGIQIKAMPIAPQPGMWIHVPAEAPSDAEGRFRLSNLPPGQYRLIPEEADWDWNTLPVVTAGQPEPVTVPAKPRKTK